MQCSKTQIVFTIGPENILISIQDNCARAVTGTNLGPAAVSTHRADCSSFFAYTVTPDASTTTVIVTPPPITQTNYVVSAATVTSQAVVTVSGTDYVSTTNVEVYPNAKRAATVSPSAVPSYASACSGTARYSSACACFGVSKTTITAPVPTSTVTVTGTPATVDLTSVIYTTEVNVVTSTMVTGPTYVDEIPCGQVITGADGYRISVNCQTVPSPQPPQTLLSTTGGDWDQCVQEADSQVLATSFTFDLETLDCVIYHDADANFPRTAAPAGERIVYAFFPQ